MTILRAAAIGGAAVTLSLAAVPGARAAVAETAGAPVRGMDISAYQHAGMPIDWAMLATQRIRFVAIKASEGTYYLNPYYASDAAAAAAAGLLVMPYVFANPGRSGGTATANFAAGAVGSRGESARLPLVVDLENDPYKKATDCYGLGITAMIGWIARFTARAKAMTGEWPTIYTTADWWRECTGSTRRFPHDPLWLAAFGGTAPTVPAPWESWTFWQYDNAGSLPGIGNTDLDYYQPTGGLPALRAPAAAVSGKTPGKRHASPAKSKRHMKGKGKSRDKKQAKGKSRPKPKPKPKRQKAHRESVSSSYRGNR
ncbi:MAG TPA: GH25 family lysozyme [Trebonia sp.]|nr:GH25 family lysozyme [Trebonia sp.]